MADTVSLTSSFASGAWYLEFFSTRFAVSKMVAEIAKAVLSYIALI